MIEEPSKTTTAGETWEEAIEEDHDAIKGILERIVATSDLHALLPLFNELRVELLEHFEREEAPEGDYDLIANMAPDTVASLQNVLGEHKVFVERLDGLIERTRTCLEGPMAEILRDAGSLSQSLHDHEAREMALFNDAVFSDLGGRG